MFKFGVILIHLFSIFFLLIAGNVLINKFDSRDFDFFGGAGLVYLIFYG